MSRVAIINEAGLVVNIVSPMAVAPPTTEVELEDSDTTTGIGTILAPPDVSAATIKAALKNALAINDAYLALGSPTNLQVAAQVNRLTRECTGIIRILIKKLDSTADT